ncbi:hypothetical protein HDU87_006349 [Geranomyces variabilis]|uniref:Uncharacterized protein n=1 Tax=Geranomyces variabilis TaxID=109894 RepID=A0AAD5THX0_9FUNG|nr:hypothetical protein HDU87_006349 [Geranomyces variabilis]
MSSPPAQLPDTAPPVIRNDEEDGPRAHKLRQVFDAALTACLKACSYERLAQAFPRIARDNPEALRSARDQLVAFIREAIKEEFEDINADRDVIPSLNQIDRIIAAAHLKLKEDFKAGRNNGTQTKAAGTAQQECLHFRVTAEQAVTAHAVQAKRREAERLKAQLAEMQEANRVARSRIAADRAVAAEMQSEIQVLIADLLPSQTLLDSMLREATAATPLAG